MGAFSRSASSCALFSFSEIKFSRLGHLGHTHPRIQDVPQHRRQRTHLAVSVGNDNADLLVVQGIAACLADAYADRCHAGRGQDGCARPIGIKALKSIGDVAEQVKVFGGIALGLNRAVNVFELGEQLRRQYFLLNEICQMMQFVGSLTSCEHHSLACLFNSCGVFDICGVKVPGHP